MSKPLTRDPSYPAVSPPVQETSHGPPNQSPGRGLQLCAHLSGQHLERNAPGNRDVPDPCPSQRKPHSARHTTPATLRRKRFCHPADSAFCENDSSHKISRSFTPSNSL